MRGNENPSTFPQDTETGMTDYIKSVVSVVDPMKAMIR